MGQRIIPEPTGMNGLDAVTTANTVAARQAAQAGVDILGAADDNRNGIASRLSTESARSFGNVFQYSTSRWAVACVIMAIVLNRTYVYASTRRNLSLGWKVRFTLRIIPIVLFTMQARWLLQSIQCQTSPDFAILRWGNSSKSSELLFIQNGGMLHTISTTLLFGASDADSCRAVSMVPLYDQETTAKPVELTGSLSRLWPLFETLCFSQFVETVSCAVQGRQIAAETGMTLFEHSLGKYCATLYSYPIPSCQNLVASDNLLLVGFLQPLQKQKLRLAHPWGGDLSAALVQPQASQAVLFLMARPKLLTLRSSGQ